MATLVVAACLGKDDHLRLLGRDSSEGGGVDMVSVERGRDGLEASVRITVLTPQRCN